MKKISGKQKLIGAMAIILIATILAIIITANIVINNKVGSEGYAATANAGSTLVANYIKNGITIGGITGTLETLNTFDATATPDDIAKGKTAYVNGIKITGTYEEKVPDLTSTNTTFTPNINYWTNQNVTVNVSTTISGYTLQLATGDPNVESNWHNATSQEMTANGTVYARLTNGRKSGGYTSYEVWNIDKTPPFANPKGTLTIGRYPSPETFGNLTENQSILLVNNIMDNESGVSKIVCYYKSDAQSSYSKSKETVYAQMNGTQNGIANGNYRYIAQFSEENFIGHGIYMYIDVYDVAGNVSSSWLSWVNADGTQTSYTQQ